jgi:hypothetical protein
MTQDFLAQFVEGTQLEVKNALEDLVKKNNIKTKVLKHAEEFAKTAATHILDGSQPELPPFPPVDINSEGAKDLQYLLVLEFLQSAGFKFTQSVLAFESQHPDLPFNRRELGKRLKLRTYDRTPYLVQLIEAAEAGPRAQG